MPGEQFKTLCLYYFPIGPPSRHVLLAAKVLGIDPTLKYIDLLKGEHMKREFLQINPEHKVPTLTDNEFALGESRAIMTYLADKYGKKESLYPVNLKKRAKVNQMLYFDAQKLMGSLISYYSPIFMGAKSFDESKKKDIEDALTLLDTFLKDSAFVAGDQMTLADIALVSSVATAIYCVDFSLKPHQHVQKWFEELEKSLPEFKTIIIDNCQQMKGALEMMKKNNN